MAYSWRNEKKIPLRKQVYGANKAELNRNLKHAIDRGWQPISKPKQGLYNISVLVELPAQE